MKTREATEDTEPHTDSYTPRSTDDPEKIRPSGPLFFAMQPRPSRSPYSRYGATSGMLGGSPLSRAEVLGMPAGALGSPPHAGDVHSLWGSTLHTPTERTTLWRMYHCTVYQDWERELRTVGREVVHVRCGSVANTSNM